jgi:hypothetical protein
MMLDAAETPRVPFIGHPVSTVPHVHARPGWFPGPFHRRGWAVPAGLRIRPALSVASKICRRGVPTTTIETS